MTAQPSHDDGFRKTSAMLSLQEAAKLLRVPDGTLRYWRHFGSGPRSFKVGRHVRCWRTDLIRWLAEQTKHAQDVR